MQIDYLAIVVLSVCAITFYRMGRHERSWGILWAVLSLAASLLAMKFLPLGLTGVFIAQAVLFGGITAYRVWKKQ